MAADPQAAPKLKIAVLHGFRQSGRRVRKQTHKMRKELADVAEFSYLTAPHAYSPAPDAAAHPTQVAGSFAATPGPDVNQFCWWNASNDNATYAGWEESLANVVHTLRTQPVDGLVGFSQGACFSALLAALQRTMGDELPFRFVVCVSGFPSRAAAHADLLGPDAPRVAMPSFHTFGTNDSMVPNEASLALADRFEAPTVASHAGGHFTPQYLPYAELRAFLAAQRPLAPAPRVAPSPPVGPLAGLQAKMDATMGNEWAGELQPAGLSTEPPALALDTDAAAAVAAAVAAGGRAEEDLLVCAWAKRLSHPVEKRSGPEPEQWRALLLRVWVALFAHRPEWVMEQLPLVPQYQVPGREFGHAWRDLASLAPDLLVAYAGYADSATPEVPAAAPHPTLAARAEEAVELIVQLFAARLRADDALMAAMGAGEANDARGWPSDCAIGAPRIKSRPDRVCRLARRIGQVLNPLHAPSEHPNPGEDPMQYTKGKCYMLYNKLVRELVRLLVQMQPVEIAKARDRQRHQLRQARIRAKVPELWVDGPLSEAVLFPEPVPVTVAPLEELQPVLEHLAANRGVRGEQAFMRGTLVEDGRLDLCKQVVGPTGIGPLMEAMQQSQHVQALLLGNNVVGDGGAPAIADAMRNPLSTLDVWYIAGNAFSAAGIEIICDALADNQKVKALWLKRNPLMPAGAAPIAALLQSRTSALQTLDLVNTGLLDDGVAAVMAGLAGNTTLRHIYLGTNGVTEVGAAAIGAHLATGENRLDTLFLAVNRIGDAGASSIAAGLRQDSRLRRLGLASNRIGAAGMADLAAAAAQHPALALLDVGFYRSTADVGEVGNRLLDEGAARAAELVRANSPALRSLELKNNAFSLDAVRLIADALRDHNDNLVFLDVRQYGLPLDDLAKDIDDALQRNRARVVAAGEATEQELDDIALPEHIVAIRSVYRNAELP